MSADVNTIALDDENLLAVRSVPAEVKLEQHAVFFSCTEIALVRINMPRSKTDKPEL